VQSILFRFVCNPGVRAAQYSLGKSHRCTVESPTARYMTSLAEDSWRISVVMPVPPLPTHSFQVVKCPGSPILGYTCLPYRRQVTLAASLIVTGFMSAKSSSR
jgi:hypothetical protein